MRQDLRRLVVRRRFLNLDFHMPKEHNASRSHISHQRGPSYNQANANSKEKHRCNEW
jgi:hypothetical protein